MFFFCQCCFYVELIPRCAAQACPVRVAWTTFVIELLISYTNHFARFIIQVLSSFVWCKESHYIQADEWEWCHGKQKHYGHLADPTHSKATTPDSMAAVAYGLKSGTGHFFPLLIMEVAHLIKSHKEIIIVFKPNGLLDAQSILLGQLVHALEPSWKS